MGSKSPEQNGHPGNDASSCSISGNHAGGEPRGAHLSRDGDACLGDDNGDDDDDDEGAATAGVNDQVGDGTDKATAQSTAEGVPKKKKRKKSKKKTSAAKQSSPPRIPLTKLFPNGQYPTGEFQSYEPVVENTARTTADEIRYLSRHHLHDETYFNDYRKAAEVHRQVRRWTQEFARPGQSLTDIAVGIDDGVRALLDNAGLEPGSGLKSGLGFPTGLSLNNCAAHWTPNPGQKDVILDKSDVMKVDFGVHINGWIVDSAFTMSFDPTYDNLLTAVKESTNTGIKNAGVDVRISDVSAAIQEVMESYEVEIGGKTFPVKPVRNITGHNIKAYQIHAGKSVPFVKTKDQTKMEEGEVFAIETFGSTGRGFLHDGPGIYGYGKSYSAPSKISSSLASARSLYKTINENFGSIVFCRRYLERLGVQRYLAGMNDLVNKGIVEAYEPLIDTPGSYSAQFEHTILLGETSKEVISRGDDY